MKMILAILAGGVGLIVTASAVLLIWFVYQLRSNKEQENTHSGQLPAVASLLLQWTFFDYALIGVFAIGSLFLFTDVLAVIRDADSYPLYHYGYLLCGFVFTLFGMLFMIARLAVVLSLVRTRGPVSSPDHHHHPSHADQPE
ncbi:hypothetical protein [Paenibacillus sp. UNC451MF]|uniref:hypothetical protein n=1 Tax=Paenibacillus sp. UNC451MF TaxID=1449063 RepID=UPI0012DD1682|nr:hypothetical protein [Paenibacillus sp. UNC451MF]